MNHQNLLTVIFVASLENLKDIANRIDSIGIARNYYDVLRWFNFFKQKVDDFCSMLLLSESDAC